MNEYLEKVFLFLSDKFHVERHNGILDLDENLNISFSKDDLVQEYRDYKELEEDLDDYIDENNLDDLKDYEIIVKHFKNEVKFNCFEPVQAVLVDFKEYITKKIDKTLSEYAKLDDNFDKQINKYIEDLKEKGANYLIDNAENIVKMKNIKDYIYSYKTYNLEELNILCKNENLLQNIVENYPNKLSSIDFESFVHDSIYENFKMEISNNENLNKEIDDEEEM